MAEKVTNEENHELVYEFEVKSNQHDLNFLKKVKRKY